MMNLTFKTEYQSIKQFNSISIADFSIITGINGSGKTHLLKAINSGNVQVDSMDPEDIVYFDLIQFRADNEAEYNRIQITNARKNAWTFFTSGKISGFGILKNVISAARNKLLVEEDCVKLKKVSEEKEIPLLRLKKRDIEDEELKKKFFKYRTNLKKIFLQETIRNHSEKQAIEVLSQKLNIFLDEIEEVEFKEKYSPTSLKNNFLPGQIGRRFLDYRAREFEEYHSLCEQGTQELTSTLKEKALKTVRDRHGGFTPWEIINDFLNAYRNFEYNISIPKEYTIASYFHQEDTPFIPKLVNSKENLEIQNDQLSSGEQILFALALCLFKSKTDKIFPELLLLDEIDASLHPSMIKNLLNVIQLVLLNQGTKVILASHSPTTLAIAEEESIFVVNKEGENRVEKCDRKDALEILTEGVMTIEKGIKVFDQIGHKEISIISEGHNVKYLEKAIQLFGDESKIGVIKGAESISGVSQLKILYDFFRVINHDKKVIFVFDPEYDERFEAQNNTFQYILPKNEENSLTKKGVENLFDDKFFEGLTKTITDDSDGSTRRNFNANKKTEFMTVMIPIANETNFRNFKPFIEFANSKM